MRTIMRLMLVAVVAMGTAGRAGAAPLAEHVPEEALLYVGWQGADEAAADFEQTHLKALLDQTRLRHLLGQTLPRLIEEQGGGDPDLARARASVEALGPLLWHRPWALYFTGLDEPGAPAAPGAPGGLDEPGRHAPPMPRLGLLIASDGDDAALRQQVAQLQQSGVPLQLSEGEGYLALTTGAAEPVDDGGLAASDRLAQATAPLPAEAVATVYVDVAGLLALGQAQAQRQAPPDEAQRLATTVEALGLEGVTSFALTAGFDGPRWQMQAFLHAPAPRQGAVQWLLEGEPIDDDALAAVPATATWLAAARVDLAALYQQVRQISEQIEPGSQAELDQLLFMASAMTGVDVEGDLLQGLGSAWIGYRDAHVAGPGSWLGLVAVNELRDSERVTRALEGLTQAANEQARPQREEEPHFRFVRFEHAGVALHSFTIPFVQPTWAIHDDRLYLALLPQGAMAAIDFAQGGGASILDNERFQTVRDRLGGQTGTTLSFADLEATAPHTYSGPLLIGQIASAMAIALSPHDAGEAIALLPPLGQVLPHLEPAGQVGWTDDTGWHFHALSPFPGSTTLAHEGMFGPSMSATGVGIMLPALGAARATARRMQSNTQARAIHQAMIVHAPGGRLPDDIWLLIEENHITADYAVSPNAPITVPHDFDRWPEQQQKQWVRENASYVLIPDVVDDRESETVAVFERPDHADRDTLAVVFNDNAAKALPVEEARQLIQAQTGQTLEALLERQQTYSDED